jgi:DNA-binding NarL/FixJ family response regulator
VADFEVRVNRIRVLLVDDNDDFLDGLTAWVSGNPRLQLAGKAHSGRSAVEQVERLHPQLVLMDAACPDMNGFEATRRIKTQPGAPLVVLLTFHETNAGRAEAWAAGADGFVSKTDISRRLAPLIRDLTRKRLEAIAERRSRKDRSLSNEKPGPSPEVSR